MRQRLALARVFLHEPELVFLDEPTQGLDPRAAVEIRNEIRERISASRCTVFLTTHNLTEAEQLCGTVAVLHRGRIEAVGTPRELRRSADADGGKTGLALRVRAGGMRPEVHRELRVLFGVKGVSAGQGELEIELADEEIVPAALRLLVEEGVDIYEARTQIRSLEDVYLSLTADDGA